MIRDDPAYIAQLDRDYDANMAAVYEERNRRARERCQCRHLDLPGTCPGPDACPLVEQPEEGEE